MSGGKGFLTETDRKYLRGEKEYTGENAKQMRYQRRQSIRDRTANAFRDFALLYHDLPPEERRKVLATIRESEGHEWGIAREGGDWLLTVAVQFIYLLLDDDKTDFANIVERAAYMAEMDLSGEHTAPSFEVNHAPPVDDVKAVLTRIDNGEVDKLSWPQLVLFTNLLRKTDQFDPGKVLEQTNLQQMARGESPFEPSRPDDEGQGERAQGREWISDTELRAALRSDRFDADDIEHLREFLRANYDPGGEGTEKDAEDVIQEMIDDVDGK